MLYLLLCRAALRMFCHRYYVGSRRRDHGRNGKGVELLPSLSDKPSSDSSSSCNCMEVSLPYHFKPYRFHSPETVIKRDSDFYTDLSSAVLQPIDTNRRSEASSPYEFDFAFVTKKKQTCAGFPEARRQLSPVKVGNTIGCNYDHRIYGPTWYLMATASLGIGHALLLCPGVTANPVTHVVSCIACDTPIQKFLLRFAVHATGSLVSHPLATLLWQTLMADLSCEGIDPEMHCMGGHEVKGQSVHVAVVLGMELVGTLVVSLVMMKTCQLSIGIYETIAKVFIGGLLHVSGKNIPAIYLNPVLANTQLLGCSDQPIIEHVMVYWIGPLVGASVAVYSTFCNQETQRKLCRPCVTFDECPPSTESSQPCRPSDTDTKCGVCDSKSRSNSSRPCRCLCDDTDDVVEGEFCEEDVEPSACRPSGCGITAQVRQTTAINGAKQLAYLFDIPPTVCKKGLRLRHNILVTKKKKPKCESDLCCDSWKDSTDSDWRNCCPFPTHRDTSPEFQSEDGRRSCYEGRDRSCSPEPPEGDCMNHSLSRGPSRVKKPQRRSSTHRKHSEHARDSVRKSHSRKSSPRASESRESPRRRHSRPSKKSHSHLDHHASTKASRHSHAATHLDHNKSLANTKSQAKAKPSKMSRADVTHHNKPSASATRPAGERTRSKV